MQPNHNQRQQQNIPQRNQYQHQQDQNQFWNNNGGQYPQQHQQQHNYPMQQNGYPQQNNFGQQNKQNHMQMGDWTGPNMQQNQNISEWEQMLLEQQIQEQRAQQNARAPFGQIENIESIPKRQESDDFEFAGDFGLENQNPNQMQPNKENQNPQIDAMPSVTDVAAAEEKEKVQKKKKGGLKGFFKKKAKTENPIQQPAPINTENTSDQMKKSPVQSPVEPQRMEQQRNQTEPIERNEFNSRTNFDQAQEIIFDEQNRVEKQLNKFQQNEFQQQQQRNGFEQQRNGFGQQRNEFQNNQPQRFDQQPNQPMSPLKRKEVPFQLQRPIDNGLNNDQQARYSTQQTEQGFDPQRFSNSTDRILMNTDQMTQRSSTYQVVNEDGAVEKAKFVRPETEKDMSNGPNTVKMDNTKPYETPTKQEIKNEKPKRSKSPFTKMFSKKKKTTPKISATSSQNKEPILEKQESQNSKDSCNLNEEEQKDGETNQMGQPPMQQELSPQEQPGQSGMNQAPQNDQNRGPNNNNMMNGPPGLTPMQMNSEQNRPGTNMNLMYSPRQQPLSPNPNHIYLPPQGLQHINRQNSQNSNQGMLNNNQGGPHSQGYNQRSGSGQFSQNNNPQIQDPRMQQNMMQGQNQGQFQQNNFQRPNQGQFQNNLPPPQGQYPQNGFNQGPPMSQFGPNVNNELQVPPQEQERPSRGSAPKSIVKNVQEEDDEAFDEKIQASKKKSRFFGACRPCGSANPVQKQEKKDEKKKRKMDKRAMKEQKKIDKKAKKENAKKPIKKAEQKNATQQQNQQQQLESSYTSTFSSYTSDGSYYLENGNPNVQNYGGYPPNNGMGMGPGYGYGGPMGQNQGQPMSPNMANNRYNPQNNGYGNPQNQNFGGPGGPPQNGHPAQYNNNGNGQMQQQRGPYREANYRQQVQQYQNQQYPQQQRAQSPDYHQQRGPNQFNQNQMQSPQQQQRQRSQSPGYNNPRFQTPAFNNQRQQADPSNFDGGQRSRQRSPGSFLSDHNNMYYR